MYIEGLNHVLSLSKTQACEIIFDLSKNHRVKLSVIYFKLDARWLVTKLDSRLSCEGLSPGCFHCLILRQDSPSSSPCPGVEIGTVLNLMLGVTLHWRRIPSRGRRNTPSHVMLGKTNISTGPMWYKAWTGT